MVHFKRLCGCEKAACYEGRIFTDGCYEDRDQWAGGFNVHIQGEIAAVSLLDKNYSPEVHAELKDFFRAEGVNRVRWERRGEEKTYNL